MSTEALPRVLQEVSNRWYKEAVEKFGEEVAKKMWQYAKDPITGYVSRDLNCVHLLDGSTPCQRCGGFGIWKPPGDDKSKEVLCVRCFDDWGDNSVRLLSKHGYVSSKKKWHAAFAEFCSIKPEWMKRTSNDQHQTSN